MRLSLYVVAYREEYRRGRDGNGYPSSLQKNFEEVHDKALEHIKEILDKLVTERGIKVDYTVRETVRKSDFFILDRDWP